MTFHSLYSGFAKEPENATRKSIKLHAPRAMTKDSFSFEFETLEIDPVELELFVFIASTFRIRISKSRILPCSFSFRSL